MRTPTITPMIEDTHGLSKERIIDAIPSVYAQEAHESRSKRYLFLPTGDLLDGLYGAGFAPTAVMQSRSKNKERQAFTKHLLRLRRLDDLGSRQPDIFEIVLINSHDGSSSYQLMQGIFRLVCGNGQIRGNIQDMLRVQHKGNMLDSVIEGTHRIVEGSAQVMEIVEEMKRTELSRDEQLLLSEISMKVRFDINEEKGETLKDLVPYKPQDFLLPRRDEDRGANDLWTVFNKIQESMIRGGVSRRDYEGRHVTREIKGIEQSVKINTHLWQLAEGMLALKQHS